MLSRALALISPGSDAGRGLRSSNAVRHALLQSADPIVAHGVMQVLDDIVRRGVLAFGAGLLDAAAIRAVLEEAAAAAFRPPTSRGERPFPLRAMERVHERISHFESRISRPQLLRQQVLAWSLHFLFQTPTPAEERAMRLNRTLPLAAGSG